MTLIKHRRSIALSSFMILMAGTWLAGCEGQTTDGRSDAEPASAQTAQTNKASAAEEPAERAPRTRIPLPEVEPESEEESPPLIPRRAADPSGRPASQANASSAGPQIAFEKLVHDFGVIWDFDVKSYEFEFTNTGEDVLVVEEIKASCGCTATTLEKRRYLPGEGASIGVEFDPSGKGRQRKTIDVITNSSSRPLIRLAIEADVRQFIAIDPMVIRFDEAQLGQPHSRIVTVSSPDPNFVILDVGTYGEHVHAELLDDGSSLGPRRPGQAAPKPRIRVSIDEQAPWGQLFGSISVTARGVRDDTAEEITETQRASVIAKVFGRVHADRTTFGLGRIDPGGDFSSTIQLWSPSGEPFEIDPALEMRSFPGATLETMPIEIAGRPGYALTVSGNAGPHMGPVQGTVVVHTDAPGEEAQLEFRVAGVVRSD